jgi:outer membrane autotransporter protein
MNNIAGSRIAGAITLGGGIDDQLNFRGGNYIYTFSSLAAATVDANGAPFLVTGNTVYVLDPTVFAQEDRVLSDLSDAIGDLTETRFDGAAPGMGWVEAAGKSHVAWGSLFASGRTDPGEDPGFGSWSGLLGGVLGVDFAVNPDMTLGVLAGGALGRLEVEGHAHTVDSSYGFGGVYGRWNSGDMFVHGELLGGFGSHDSERLIANNMVPGGVEMASASYNGWFVSPEVGVGWNRVRPDGLMLTPAFKLRYVGAHFDGYSEAGSSDDHTVGDRFVHALEGRAEIGLSPEAPQMHGSHQLDWAAHAGVVVAGRFGDDIESSLGPAIITFDLPGEAVQVGAYVGGSVDLLLSGTCSLFAGGEATLWSDGTLSGNLNLGLKAGF